MWGIVFLACWHLLSLQYQVRQTFRELILNEIVMLFYIHAVVIPSDEFTDEMGEVDQKDSLLGFTCGKCA